MKLIDLIFSMLLLGILILLIESGIYTGLKLDNRCREIQIQNEMNEFIFRSFRNACEGKGFSSLEEWQKTCRAMWNLSYIGFCDAKDFMQYENKNEKLMYGTWTYGDERKEVYFRMISEQH